MSRTLDEKSDGSLRDCVHARREAEECIPAARMLLRFAYHQGVLDIPLSDLEDNGSQDVEPLQSRVSSDAD